MEKNYRARLFLVILAAFCITGGFQGCGKGDVIEMYPPIVFKPVYGELGGGAISDNMIVSVVDAMNGKPVSGARIFLHQGEPLELVAEEVTGVDGNASFAGKGVSGPVTVTVTCNETIAFDTVSFVDVNAAKLVVPLERRKSPDRVKTSLTFIGLDAGDTKLSAFRNDTPLDEISVKSGKIDEDPWIQTVEKKPLAFSALVMDPGGNTTKYGFTVEPDGPLPVATPAMVNLVRVSTENVKICRGKIENPPSNLEEPNDGWDPFSRYIFQVFSEGGLAGDVVAGFANLDNGFGYQAFIVKTPGLEKQKMEVSAFNRRDAWSEMTTAYAYFNFDSAPEKVDFSFMKAPKNLQMEKVEGRPLPNLIWSSPEGNLKQVDIFHADYNYRWTLYMAGTATGKVSLPPLDLGSPGGLIAGEIYRFRVVEWQVPGLDFNNMTFQGLQEKVTHRSRSSLVQFMVTAPETN